MKRFYRAAIKSLKDIGQDENAEDIANYVKYLEHERSVLISELSRAETLSGKELLRRMGY